MAQAVRGEFRKKEKKGFDEMFSHLLSPCDVADG